MITVCATSLPSVLRIIPESFEDHRGCYVETYSYSKYKEKGIDIIFVQDDYSRSCRNVLRGLHGDEKTWKLISCPYGRLYLAVVNCDPESAHFGKWEGFTLSESNRQQVLIPPKHGNGHLILSEEAIFSYKQSEEYAPDSQFSYRWDDPRFNIWWPISAPILSRRDSGEK